MNYKTKHTLKQTALILLAWSALTAAAMIAHGQIKQLPDTARIKLSQRDLLSITTRIDSLQNALVQSSNLPSSMVQSFNYRLNVALSVMYRQVEAQMVADKPKVSPSVKK